MRAVINGKKGFGAGDSYCSPKVDLFRCNFINKKPTEPSAKDFTIGPELRKEIALFNVSLVLFLFVLQ